MRTALIVAALLLVVAGLWWAAASSGDPSSGSLSATSEASAPPPAAPPTTSQSEPTSSKPSPPAAPPPSAAKIPNAEATPAPPPQAAVRTTAPIPPPQASGPVDQLKQRFASEPRDSAANAIESRVQAVFRDPKIAPGVLGAVLCHETVCKLEMRWTEANAMGYMLGLSNLLPEFSTDLAISPTGPRDGSGVIPLDVYWGRKPAPTP